MQLRCGTKYDLGPRLNHGTKHHIGYRTKMIFSVTLVWGRGGAISFGSRTKSHLGPRQNCILVKDQITLGSGTKSHTGSRTEVILGSEPNRIIVQGGITFGSGAKYHLSPGQIIIAFGSGVESNFEMGLNCIWVRG